VVITCLLTKSSWELLDLQFALSLLPKYVNLDAQSS